MIRIRSCLQRGSQNRLSNDLDSRDYTAKIALGCEEALVGFVIDEEKEGVAIPAYDYFTLVNSFAQKLQQELKVSDDEAVSMAMDDISYNFMGTNEKIVLLEFGGEERSISLEEYQANVARGIQDSIQSLSDQIKSKMDKIETLENIDVNQLPVKVENPNKADLVGLLGDIMCYVATVATKYGVNLEEVGDNSLSKIEKTEENQDVL
tara:strand:+ start:13 stop:633 length:621 start_codon:yes stop_codon:yes gene_type:complete